MMFPEQKRFDELCDAIARRLEKAGVGVAALQATLPEVREQLAKRRYPGLSTGKPSKRFGVTRKVKGTAKG